jgi:hypothetical protein
MLDETPRRLSLFIVTPAGLCLFLAFGRGRRFGVKTG